MRNTYIEVREGSKTFHRAGTSKAGKPYDFYQQEVFINTRRGETKLMTVNIDDESKAYRPGFYTIDDDFLGVVQNKGGFDQIGLTSIVLVPIPAAELKKAA